MAYGDPLFALGMSQTLHFRSQDMSRTKNFYENIEDLTFSAIEQGANTVGDVYAYVTQYVPKSMVSYETIEKIMEEYSAVEYETDNVY
jgi:hypothetical protein